MHDGANSTAAGSAPRRQKRKPGSWKSNLLALLIPLVGISAIDLGLRLFGAVPPTDPMTMYVRSFEKGFSPFVDVGGDDVTIRPDWVGEGEAVHVAEALPEGRFLIYPEFRPTRFSRVKDPGTIRIFALGGSTTFGMYLGAEQAFPARLGERLGQVFPDREVEVINLGCLGWASQRISGLLNQLWQYDPDLVVIYCGHNEMLSDTIETSPDLTPLQAFRIRLASFSTIFGWVNHAVRHSRITAGETERITEEAMAVELGKIRVYDPMARNATEFPLPGKRFLDQAARRYGRNLKRMAASARSAKTPVVFILPVANLMMPPRISGHAGGFDQEEMFDHLLERAAEHYREQEYEQSLDLLDKAVALSPHYAAVRYNRGLVLWELGDESGARAEFRAACDLDIRTHRITSRLEETFVQVMKKSRAPWVDLRPHFQKQLTIDEATRLFFDHVHPTSEGIEVILDELVPVVLPLLENRRPEH